MGRDEEVWKKGSLNGGKRGKGDGGKVSQMEEVGVYVQLVRKSLRHLPHQKTTPSLASNIKPPK